MATPMHDKGLCFFRDPETQEAAAEARRLGGLRRRKESTIVGAYEVGELDSVQDLTPVADRRHRRAFSQRRRVVRTPGFLRLHHLDGGR